MNHKDLINTCVFEQFEGLLFSDLSGPLININNHNYQQQWTDATSLWCFISIL